MRGASPPFAWLALLSWREACAHPWRYVVIVLALASGVALAWSVHLINASALAEFAASVRTTQGEPDATLRGAPGAQGGLPDAWLDRLAGDPAVARAVAVIEIDTYARAAVAAPGSAASAPASTARRSMRVIGLDALTIAPLAPALMPRPAAGLDGVALLDPQRVYLNAAARRALAVRDGETLELQAGPRWVPLTVSGDVAAGGAPLAVVDLAAAQSHFGWAGRVSRIDVRLLAGATVATVRGPLPPGALWSTPDDAAQRVSNLSRAYRVNLSVLALVALFVGAFMAYSVVALAVAQRTAAFALLGVLGLTAAERRRLVLLECAVLGAAGSVIGLLLGTALASWALQRLGGDLGGGYFPGVVPTLRFDPWGAVVMGSLGVVAALVGGWVPARHAEQLRPAQALKGLGSLSDRTPSIGWPLAMLVAAAALSQVPAWAGVPWAAYGAVAALLFGGVALVPWMVHALLSRWPLPRSALGLLALRRAHFHRQTATAVVAGVVASLALSVALTVMVASFRSSVTTWLDQVLPADLYLRTAASSAAGDQAWLSQDFEDRAVDLPGVRQGEASRIRALSLARDAPAVTLIARRLGAGSTAAERLPMVSASLVASPGEVGVYVSEAMVSLYGAKQGDALLLPLTTQSGDASVNVKVLGVWRDFARQFGTVVIDLESYRRITGDMRLNEMSVWLQAGTDVADVQTAMRALAPDPSMVEFATTAELRRTSLRIFDRSFAVTSYLQAVAIVIGLLGMAAGLSAQVLARRKEFGLLSHLGLIRRQIVVLVAIESLAWLMAGATVGVLLGLAIGAILVHVVNPQSFHWTMQMNVPWMRLAALVGAVVLGGVLTAVFSARAAASRDATRAVKEDW